LYDPNEPGSLLVFPKFVRGTVAAGLPATEIEISVHCPTALNVEGYCTLPVPGTSVRLEGHWVCAGQLSTGICTESDFFVNTTVEGTVDFNTEGSAVGVNFATVKVPTPKCSEGYLVMWAVNTTGRPIVFNGLLGVAEVRWNSHAAGSYEAIAIQANGDEGDLIATTTGTTGLAALPFTGAADQYRLPTSTIMATIKYDTDSSTPAAADAPSSTSIVTVTLDVLSGLPNNYIVSDLNFADNVENLYSEQIVYQCFEEITVSGIDPFLVRENLSRKGFFYSLDAYKIPTYANDPFTGPVTQLGLIDTTECPSNTTGSCAPYTIPVTSTANPTVTNHYMYRTDDDSVGVPTVFQP